jgi:uncharacterized protein (TIGR03083 family)
MTQSNAVRAQISAQRRELVAILTALGDEQWNAPTLCAGWRVREVAAHITMPFRLTPAMFEHAMAAASGDFNRMADIRARADATIMSTADLIAALNDNVDHPWQPPGGGYPGALSHDLVHGLDITVPLGIDWAVPRDRLRTVLLDLLTPQNLAAFGIDLDRIQLHADDLAWSVGTGAPVTGAGQDVLLAAFGRQLPAGRLRGAGGGSLYAINRT